MSVGDGAKEFMLVHTLGRERLLVLSCGLPSNPLKIIFFADWETAETFVSAFHTPAPICSFNGSLVGARYT